MKEKILIGFVFLLVIAIGILLMVWGESLIDPKDEKLYPYLIVVVGALLFGGGILAAIVPMIPEGRG